MITPQTVDMPQQTMFQQLINPLQSHMLQHLKAQHLAALRSTCAAGCQLIDRAQVETLCPALQMLPGVVLDRAHDSLGLQRLLRAQAETCQRLRAGTIVPQLTMLAISQGDQSDGCHKVLWEVAGPGQLCVTQHKRGRDVTLTAMCREAQGSQAWHQVAEAQGFKALTWCQHSTWLVCERSTDHTLALFNARTGALVTSQLRLSDASEFWPGKVFGVSAKGDHVVVRTPETRMAVCHLPDLTPAWHILGPAFQLRVGPSEHDWDNFWFEWSATGEHLAVIQLKNRASSLRILGAWDGEEVCSFPNWAEQCGPFEIYDSLCVRWSANGRNLATLQYEATHGISFCLGWMSLDGFHKFRAQDLPAVFTQYPCWSPSGRYVYLQHDNPSGTGAHAGIWDAQGQEQLYSKYHENYIGSAAWAQHHNQCIFMAQAPGPSIVVNLAGEDDNSELTTTTVTWDLHSKHGLEILQCTFSPCSKLLVVYLGPPSCTIGSLPNKVRLSKSLQNVYQLWHADLGQVGSCAMLICVAEFEAAVRLDAVAWHPSPHLCLLYAISCRDGSIHLVDGLHNTLLYSWTPDWLASIVSPPANSWTDFIACASIRAAKQISLSWSPDGSTLMTLPGGYAILMVFES